MVLSEDGGYTVPSSMASDMARSMEQPALDDEQLGRFRARQIHTVVRLSPLTTVANAVNALVLCAMFWHDEFHAFIVPWALGVIGLMTMAMRAWFRTRGQGPRPYASPRVERHAMRHALLLSSFWALAPAVLMPHASAAGQGLLGCICVAMMCAGGFALASLPRAGITYAVIIGAGAFVGVLRSPELPQLLLIIMLALYVVIITMSVRWTAASFQARLLAEAAAERQRDLVGLLLHDFEAHAADALWEADADGRLRHVSQRLADMLRQPVMRLVGRRLHDLFEAGATSVSDDWIELNDDGNHTLEHCLGKGKPFHDMVLSFKLPPHESGGDSRTGWIQLAAKPLRDAAERITGWRGVASNITAAHEAQLRVTKLAFVDAVTGLHNRHTFQIRLGQMVAQEGAERACTVICMDLDGFKTVNDALGHDIGDGLLRSVAERLSALLLPQDLFARLGGDEFGFILDGVSSPEEASGRADQLLQALRTPLEVVGASVPIGASLGIALVPRDGTSTEGILKHADLALYAAKAAGRGQYRFYLPHMGAKVQHRLSIERALRDALREDQLSLFYQPQLRLTDGEIVGFEALLRWHHPTLGQVSPADFVPVAEDAGLIGDIGEWVLRRACEDAVQWQQPLRVAVNLSPLQIMAQDLQSVIRSALQESTLPPHRLEVEVTESVLLNETQATLSQLHGIRALGSRIALDDFGTGYSSMAYLRRFPFDKLKIDRAFVSELVSREDARAIVHAILELAAALHMETVAEGVETVEELGVLRDLRCGAAQGYLVARPMDQACVLSFIDRWPQNPLRREFTVPAAPALFVVG